MRQAGFTIIELLIYLTLSSTFVTGLVVVLGDVQMQLTNRQQDFFIHSQKQFVFTKIEWLLNSAKEVTITNESSIDVLLQNGTVLGLRAQDGGLYIVSSDRLPEPLLPERLRVQSMSFVMTTNGTYDEVRLMYQLDGDSYIHYHYGSH